MYETKFKSHRRRGEKIADHEFVIPLRLEEYETPFTMAHAQYIDFGRGWKSGFSELLETLDQRYGAPKAQNERSPNDRHVDEYTDEIR